MPQKKAKSRGIKLVEASLGQARTLVMAPDNPPDASMADDPAFERRAAAFEQRLAARCFNDPRAQQVAAAMCARIPLYLTARLRRIPDVPARRREMRVIFVALSGQRSFAGTVVQSDPMLDLDTDLERLVLAVINVITGGNLRERMNLVDQFMHLLDRDLRAAKSFDEIEEIADEAHLDRAALAKRFASGKGKPALLDPAPAKTLLAERDLVRVPTNNRAPFSAMSARDMRLAPPSQGERDHMKAPKSDSKM